MIRRLIPYSLLPLALVATGLASGLWLRAFPSSVMAAPLLGACLISVLLPVTVASLFTHRLWVTALLDATALLLYLLFVVLRDPAGFGDLWTGLVHGPSQLLTFALPLVSPRSLLVAPVVLCWISGAVAGECFGRGWQTVLPYVSWLVTFGLTYAGTARAITSASVGRREDTLLGAGLLCVLLLTRAAQSWVGQDDGAEVTQANGVLPVRGFTIGAALALLLAAGAAIVVQSSTFAGPPTTPQRVPSVDKGQPLTPLSFVSDLRSDVLAGKAPQAVFQVGLNRPAPGYFALATVDYYDGDSWSFQRTFRPSGGVIPGEADPALRPGTVVTQTYRLDGPVLAHTPWMPYVARPARVVGAAVDVDAGSGMIVPAEPLQSGDTYKITSRVPRAAFDELDQSAFPASSVGPSDRGVPGELRSELTAIIASFAQETGVPSSPAIPFLQAVARDLRAHYALTGKSESRPATGNAPSRSSRSPSARSSARSSARPSASSPASSAPPAPPGSRAGATSFRDVVESILGTSRAGTPEQYATLMALMARQLDVPARVVTGFRVVPRTRSGPLHPGTYTVTTGEAWTWAELPVANNGWVVLDPSPGTYSGNRQSQQVGTAPSRSPSSTSAPNALVTGNDRSGAAVAPRSSVPVSHGLSTAELLVVVLVALCVLACAIVAILLLRKRLRARRRRRPSDPRRRLLGAWHESIDVLIESGLPELEAMTSAEIASATTARFGDTPGEYAAHLGEAANAAIFSPTSWVTSADADAAWSEHWLLRTEVRRTLRIRDRFAAGIRYHHLRERAPLSGPASWAEAIRMARDNRRRHGKHERRH